MSMFKSPNASMSDKLSGSKKQFEDPISPRQRKMHSSIDPKSEDTFRAPSKEMATTGRYASPGDDYGIGFRTPVGKNSASSMSDGPIPQKSQCYNPNDI